MVCSCSQLVWNAACGRRKLTDASDRGLTATSDFVKELNLEASTRWCHYGSFEGSAVYALEETKAGSIKPAFQRERFSQSQFSVDQSFLMMSLVIMSSVLLEISPSLDFFGFLCPAFMAAFAASMLCLTISRPHTYISNRYAILAVFIERLDDGQLSQNVMLFRQTESRSTGSFTGF